MKEEKFILARNPQQTVYDWIIKICLYLGVFLIPLFFLPSSTDYFELPKAILFYFLVSLAFISWFIKVIVKKEITLSYPPLSIFIILFIILYGLATIFSISHYSSLVGFPGYYNHNLFSVLFLALFYFLTLTVLQGRKDILRMLVIFLISSFLIILFNLFQFSSFYIWPFDFTHFKSFNLLANSASVLGIYLALTTILFLGASLFFKKIYKILSFIGLASSFALLVILDKDIAWYGLIGGLLFFLIVATLRSRELESLWVVLPTVLLALALIFLFISSPQFTKIELLDDVTLSQSHSWQVTQLVLKKSPLLGSGPQTFAYDFIKYRPLDFNNSNLWNLRFIKSSNEWFQLLTTSGIFTTLAFGIIISFYLFYSLRRIIRSRSLDQEWFIQTVSLGGGIVILISLFFYPLNFVTSFILWLFLALGMAIYNLKNPKIIEYVYRNSSWANFVLAILFTLVLISIMGFWFWGGKIWLADYNFYKANKAISQTEELSKVRDYLNRSIELNPYLSNYHFALAQGLSVEAQLMSSEPSAEISQIQDLVGQSLNEAQKGADLDKNYSGAWETQASIYESLRALIGPEVDTLINSAYQKALELEPNNPALHLGLGQNYQLMAWSLKTLTQEEELTPEIKSQINDLIDKAILEYDKAVQLKSNYLEASYNLALALEQKGENEKAIEEIKSLAQSNRFNPEIWYELGQIYLRSDNQDQALEAYQEAVRIDPNYSNAHFQAAMIYEQKGEKDKAIEALEIVQRLNPDNEIVKQKLEELRE